VTTQFIVFFRMGRWWIAKATHPMLGWSGSRWVPFGGGVQVANFGSRAAAISEGMRLGFEHAPELELATGNRQLPTGGA